MSNRTAEPVALLAELRELPSIPARAARLADAGDADSLLLALGDEAERLVVIEVARAKASAELILELADRLGAARSRARIRRALAQAPSYAGEFSEAIQRSREAIAIAEDAGETVQAARARLGLMHAYAETGRYEQAIEIGEEARRMLMAAGEPALAARADLNLGVTHQNHDQPARALEHFDRARPLLASEPIILAQLDSNRGESLLALDEFRLAEAAFDAARATFEQHALGWAVAIVEGNLADLAARRGALDRALYHFERARRCIEGDQSSAHLARLLAEQGEAKLLLGMANDAIKDFEQALPSLDANHQQAEAARTRSALGRALLTLHRFSEADAILAEASIAHASLGHDIARRRTDLIRTAAAIEQSRMSDAEALLNDIEPSLDAHSLDWVTSRFHRATLLLARDQPQEAMRTIDEALISARSLDIAPLLADLYLLRGHTAQRLAQPTEAIAGFRNAVEQIERVRNTLQADRFRAAFLGNRLRAYESLALALLDQNESRAANEAFETLELARNRTLLDLLRGVIQPTDALAETTADPGVRALLEDVEETRARLNAQYQRADRPTATGSDDWQREVRRLESRLNALEGRLAATQEAHSIYAPPPSSHLVQQALTIDTALIEYSIIGDEVFAFIVRRNRLTVTRRLMNRRDLVEQIRRIQFQLGRALRPGAMDGGRGARLTNDLNRELDAIGESLIAPLEEELMDASRLIIVPHGPLHSLPFSAVRRGGSFLIERFEVTTAPSAAFITTIRNQPAPTANHGMLVLGVPDECAPNVEREAQAVARTVPDATLLIGEEATTERFRADAPSARLLHLACHGRFDAESPLSSGLKLADRWLTVRDLSHLRLSADLVTLSACETGRSAIAAGDEQTGLVRGLLTAGARSVIVSLWRVNDAMTLEFMRHLYNLCYSSRDEMKAGTRSNLSIAQCLHRAQLSTMQSHPHPAFWAPFILVGGFR